MILLDILTRIVLEILGGFVDKWTGICAPGLDVGFVTRRSNRIVWSVCETLSL
jgi:hypothetical protein